MRIKGCHPLRYVLFLCESVGAYPKTPHLAMVISSLKMGQLQWLLAISNHKV